MNSNSSLVLQIGTLGDFSLASECSDLLLLLLLLHSSFFLFLFLFLTFLGV
jgi:hypothetical protein